MDSRRWFWSILLLGVFATVVINWYVGNRGRLEQKPAIDALVPDIILDQTSQTNFADDGRRHFEVNATEALHYSSRGMTEFRDPHLVFFQRDEHHWDARADNGLTPDNGETFRLRGRVFIRQLNPGRDAIELQTDSIEISSTREVAETSDPVVILQGPNRTEATGLHVDMQTGKLTLPQRVRSRYQPPST